MKRETIVAGCLACTMALPLAAERIVYDFETGDLQGWKVTKGANRVATVDISGCADVKAMWKLIGEAQKAEPGGRIILTGASAAARPRSSPPARGARTPQSSRARSTGTGAQNSRTRSATA